MAHGTLLKQMGTAMFAGLLVMAAPATGSAAAAVTAHHQVSPGTAQPGASQHPIHAQHVLAPKHQKASPHHDLAALVISTAPPLASGVGDVAETAILVSERHAPAPVGRGPPAS